MNAYAYSYICMHHCTYIIIGDSAKHTVCAHIVVQVIYVVGVCMYACMHVRMYACMHVCMYAYMHVCMYACMYVRMYRCTNVQMYVFTYVRMHVCLCVAVDLGEGSGGRCGMYGGVICTIYTYVYVD